MPQVAVRYPAAIYLRPILHKTVNSNHFVTYTPQNGKLTMIPLNIKQCDHQPYQGENSVSVETIFLTLSCNSFILAISTSNSRDWP